MRCIACEFVGKIVFFGISYFTMIDYMTSSSGGSDTLSNTTGLGAGTSTTSSSTRGSRVRTVRLVRPPCGGTLPPPGLTCRHGPGLGFSVRGGREHGTGFFISQVEVGSEAHRQGLKIGDQIIRVNGFTVEDAVHKEVLQLISNHTHLTLKVRSVGMIPVKDRSTDPLSWQIIPDFTSILSESPPLEEKHHDVRISIAVAQRAKLGCGICKGPDWKPGIFVQFTKEGGIARDAGLRPGDQILYCNNVDFTDISFNEAVNIMKTSRQLDLIIRKGAGSELFPGESSGYNSSASSVTGDQSPSWSDSKRLSIVKEESLELEDRLSHIDFQRFKPKTWEKISYDWDENPRHFKPTIINLSENGTTIKNNGTVEECQNNITEDNSNKLADICLVQQQHETKTVVVEVHRSDMEEEKTEDLIKKSPSAASFTSSTSRSSTASSSLSSAISLELQRRSERNKDSQKKINIEEEIQKKKVLNIKGVDSEKKHQHDKLMDEFKRAHRKMFNSSVEETSDTDNGKIENIEIAKDRQLQLSQRRSTIAAPEEASERLAPLVNTSGNGSTFPGPRNSPVTNNLPPPPPPMPALEPSDTNTNANVKLKPSTKPKAPPVPQKNFHQPLPPPCPTPDYDTLSLISNGSTLPRQNGSNPVKLSSFGNGYNTINGNTKTSLGNPGNAGNPGNPVNPDTVDMESLESFKLNHPSVLKPKPPNTYFNKPKLTGQMSAGSISSQSSQTSQSSQSSQSTQSSQTSMTSTLRKPRPVSVTIGEYQNKRLPINKFDFLTNSEEQTDSSHEEPITSRLASELAQTLSRSNLRKRTETNLQDGKGGIVTISVNENKTAQHKLLTKSQSTDVNASRHIENLSKVLANRVTIKISETDLKNDASPNSILKNGNELP